MIPREELTSPTPSASPYSIAASASLPCAPDSGDEEGEIRHLLAEIPRVPRAGSRRRRVRRCRFRSRDPPARPLARRRTRRSRVRGPVDPRRPGSRSDRERRRRPPRSPGTAATNRVPCRGLTVIASTVSSSRAYCRVVFPISARLASSRTGTPFRGRMRRSPRGAPAVRVVEGRVRLEDRGVLVGRVDDAPVERPPGEVVRAGDRECAIGRDRGRPRRRCRPFGCGRASGRRSSYREWSRDSRKGCYPLFNGR